MFEYAVSAGEGTLLSYGAEDAHIFNIIFCVQGDVSDVFFGDGIILFEFDNGTKSAMVRTASPDCTTGQ
jgi:hypothetical protein